MIWDMKEEKSGLPKNWISILKEKLSAARDGLSQAQEFLDFASTRRDPGIDLTQLAERLYKGRRARERFLPSGLFGEPCWDLLLDLYIARHRKRIVTTTGACIAACVPMSTGLRWLEKLEAASIVERSPCPRDHRLILVTLTDEGVDRMSDLLIQIALMFPFKRLVPLTAPRRR